MTETRTKPRTITPGHPPSWSTRRNARAAEFRVATSENRRRREPEPCDQCRGWHLAETTTTDTTGAS